MKYRRKPEIVEAMQLTKTNRNEILKWMGDTNGVIERSWDPVNIQLRTVLFPDEGQLLIPGDYIIKYAPREFQIIPKDRFEMDYEPENFVPGKK